MLVAIEKIVKVGVIQFALFGGTAAYSVFWDLALNNFQMP